MFEEPSYLTAEGLQRMQSELEYLKGPAREQLALRLRAAIQQGDLSENADYSAAKEDQSFLEGRIQELERILRNVHIIDETKQGRETVDIGARVTVEEEGFDAEEYQMVGPKEANPADNRISYESPLGKALMNHRVGDVVVADTPNGKIRFKITQIR